MSMDRRTALKGLGALAALSTMSCKADESTKKPADTGSDDDGPPPEMGWPLLRERVKHVVIVMMENRSFDHYFGALTLEEGRTDVEGLTAEMSNPHPDGREIGPFLSTQFCVEDPPHGWSSCHDQWNGGKNDGFVSEFYDRHAGAGIAEEAMGYFNRDTLSAFYTLADHYVLCDHWFCSVLSSTWPNRFYSHAAQNAGIEGNDFADYDFDSLYTRLRAKGIPWKDYFSNVPFTMLLNDVNPEDPEMTLVEQFYDDAANGALPTVSVVEPIYGKADDHPPAHPKAGQIFVASIYEALAASPHWEETLLIITYDEHGGFFDHVDPPALPDIYAKQGFGQAGFRVPTLVVGPWVKPGHVSKVVYDHTSMLAFLGKLLQFEPLTERDAAADPMLDVFDEDALVAGTPHDPVALAPIRATEEEIYAEECLALGGFLDPVFPTHQPELEAYLEATYEPARLARVDRRLVSGELYEDLLVRAEALGLLERI